VEELLTSLSNFCRCKTFRIRNKTTVVHACLKWTAAAKRVRLVGRSTLVNRLTHDPSSLVVMRGRDGSIDGNFMKIRSTQPEELRVCIREQSPLQQRICREVDARDDMSRMERHLFCFGKKIVGYAVQDQSANPANGDNILRNELRGIQEIEVEGVLVFLGDYLHAKLKFRVITGLDGFIEIAAMEVWILPREFLRLIPDQRVHAENGLPMKFHEPRNAFSVHQSECVDPKALHHSKTSGN